MAQRISQPDKPDGRGKYPGVFTRKQQAYSSRGSAPKNTFGSGVVMRSVGPAHVGVRHRIPRATRT